jgi:glucosyl-dolichyl phosphate glucuronosyltransferase
VSSMSISVVICAYTEARWDMLRRAVDSALEQTVRPREVIIVIDHNDALYRRALECLVYEGGASTIPVRVLENRFGGRLGSARTTGCERACGDVVAFLDDDAIAAPDWLEQLTAPYAHNEVIAVGGSPMPLYESKRPRWFPNWFDWVFGCTYEGLPTSQARITRMIGANMSARRSAIAAVGGFHSDNHDDMDLSHRLAAMFPEGVTLFEPQAVVRHFVPRERATFKYFTTRCFRVNRGKVAAQRSLPQQVAFRSDRQFVARTLRGSMNIESRALAHGDVFGVARLCVMFLGVALAGCGYVIGLLEWRLFPMTRPRDPVADVGPVFEPAAEL